jgi:hypothetical protein
MAEKRERQKGREKEGRKEMLGNTNDMMFVG